MTAIGTGLLRRGGAALFLLYFLSQVCWPEPFTPENVLYPPLLEKLTLTREKEGYRVRVRAFPDPNRSREKVQLVKLIYWQSGPITPLLLQAEGDGFYSHLLPPLESGTLHFYIQAEDTGGNIALSLPSVQIPEDENLLSVNYYPILTDPTDVSNPDADILSIHGAITEETIYLHLTVRGEIVTKEQATRTHPIYGVSFSTASDEFSWDTGLARYLAVYLPNSEGLLPFGGLPYLGDAFLLEREVRTRFLTFGVRQEPIPYRVQGKSLYLSFPRRFVKQPSEKGWLATFFTASLDNFVTWEIPLEVPTALFDQTPYLRLYVQDYTFTVP